MIIFIWTIFTVISTIELCNIVDVYYLQIFYLCGDVLSKTLINVVVHDYIERQTQLKQNTDLQSIQFISYMLNNIQIYRTDNIQISMQCEHVIDMVKQVFTSHIPENENLLKMELLSKILPFGLEKQVINMGNTELQQSDDQQYENICVLFTDVVNYAELACALESKTIFRILDNMYRCFDSIIRKYKFLQKIETIGDAYMVVGDINRSNQVEYKHVAESMLELAIEFLKEIKNIKTPSADTLHIRIGIHIGGVSIGVLGTEIPRLCIVGNTVNIASRLQSTCPVDSIHISRDFYDLLNAYTAKNVHFVLEKHNRTFLKHIGTMTTYSLKPIYCGNTDGITNESKSISSRTRQTLPINVE
jgi:class 3 adenylate cyclase